MSFTVSIGNPNDEKETELNIDLNKILNSGWPGMEAFAKIEYEKCLELLKEGSSESNDRAVSLMYEVAEKCHYLPSVLWLGDYAENVKKDLKEACLWYKRASSIGSAEGARNYADMLLNGFGVEKNIIEALKYYSLAADRGLPDAMFTTGELLRAMGYRDDALEAYKDALNAGFEPAKIRIEQMVNGEI